MLRWAAAHGARGVSRSWAEVLEPTRSAALPTPCPVIVVPTFAPPVAPPRASGPPTGGAIGPGHPTYNNSQLRAYLVEPTEQSSKASGQAPPAANQPVGVAPVAPDEQLVKGKGP